jgi:hypothetical protein
MDTNETLGHIASLAQSIIDVCRSDIADKSEPVEALAQKVGCLADKVLSETGGGVKRELGDWLI